MGKTEHSYISRYLVEQDNVKAPSDLFESTYQRLREYQLTHTDSVSSDEIAFPKSRVSLMTLILSFSTIAVAGLIYLMATTNNQGILPYDGEGVYVSNMTEYTEEEDFDEGYLDNEGYLTDDGTLEESQDGEDEENVDYVTEPDQAEGDDWIFELIIRPLQDE